MTNSEQVSRYSAEDLPTLLADNPSERFIGLKIKQENDHPILHSIYIEKENISEELPFGALITIFGCSCHREEPEASDKKEFFLEALTVEQLIGKLQRFDKVSSFLFLKVSKSVTMDIVHEMFCKLSNELSEEKVTSPSVTLLEKKSLELLDKIVIGLEA